MNNDELNSRHDDLAKQIVTLVGTDSPSDGFVSNVMQRIEEAQSANRLPSAEISRSDSPIIRPVAWLWAVIIGIATIVVSYVFAQEPSLDGKISLPDLPRFSELFANAINTEAAQIFALVVIITSCLFAIDIALSHRKTERRGGA